MQSGAKVTTYSDHERYLAIRELHYRHPGGVPTDPPEVAAAHKAMSELVQRHKTDMRWSRDTRRAVDRFARVIDAHRDHLVDLAHSLGLLPLKKRENS